MHTQLRFLFTYALVTALVGCCKFSPLRHSVAASNRVWRRSRPRSSALVVTHTENCASLFIIFNLFIYSFFLTFLLLPCLSPFSWPSLFFYHPFVYIFFFVYLPIVTMLVSVFLISIIFLSSFFQLLHLPLFIFIIFPSSLFQLYLPLSSVSLLSPFLQHVYLSASRIIFLPCLSFSFIILFLHILHHSFLSFWCHVGLLCPPRSRAKDCKGGMLYKEPRESVACTN